MVMEWPIGLHFFIAGPDSYTNSYRYILIDSKQYRLRL